MPKQCYNLNRPFHLGRRDVFYETAVSTMRLSMEESSARRLRQRLDLVLYCLHSALEHGSLAHQAQRAPAEEKPFLQFLEMLLARLQAGRLMLLTSRQWARDNSPVRQFLACQAPAAEVPASALQTSVPDIFRDALAFVRSAAEPLRNLQTACVGKLPSEDRARYEKAAASLRSHLAATADHPRPRTFVQSAYPVLETTDG
jgi:hypothetical protein